MDADVVPKFSFPDPMRLLELPFPLDFTSDEHGASSTYLQPGSPNGSKKRRRSSCDISKDEPVLPSTKKRRLRLYLITSRLSRPFSYPASHIGAQGPSRIAVYAKHHNIRDKSLRRVAIINLVRRNSLDSEDGNNFSGSLRLRENMPEDDVRDEALLLNPIRQEAEGGEFSQRNAVSLLSNYEELDKFEGYLVLDDDEKEEEFGDSADTEQLFGGTQDDEIAVYDFNFLAPVQNSQHDDDCYEDIWACLPAEWYEDERTPARSDERSTRPIDGLSTPAEPVSA
jgi:hypothetical protein